MSRGRGLMLSSGARWALAVPLLVLLAACSGGSEAAVTSTVGADPVVTTVTTLPPSTTTTVVTPTTTAEPGRVGDPGALRDLGERIRESAVEFGYTQFDGIEIPYPDLSDPDPVEALREALAFEAWLLETGPHPSFAELYNYAEGPRRTEVSTRFSSLLAGNRRYEGVVDGYEVVSAEQVPLDRADIVDHEREQVPAGSVAVKLTGRGGPEQIVDQTTGDVVDEVEPYGGTSILIVAPSEFGWQIFWQGEPLP